MRGSGKMDETTFRILDTLSRNLGSPLSINELTNRVRRLHRTAYYKNIYDKIQEMRKKGIIELHRIGKSSIITLNFNSYHLTDMLAQMEMDRKQRLLQKKMQLQMLLKEMETHFKQGFCLIDSISIIRPENNLKFNRAEFLFILKEPLKWKSSEKYERAEREGFIQSETFAIHPVMQKLRKTHNIKMDYLVLKERDFFELLEEKQQNPLKGMLLEQIAFFSPQNYWVLLKTAMVKGIRIEKTEEINPANISEQDLAYNLNRFGYREMGSSIRKGSDVCLEYLIVSILIRNDARRIEVAPLLLAKNKPRYNLLIFLCMKYGQSGMLLGLLKALNSIIKNKETQNAIKILEKMKVREEKADKRAVRQKMRLYNAI
jgi:hypothetical protein